MDKSKGEDLSQNSQFLMDTENIFFCLYRRRGNMNIIVSFNSQKHDVYSKDITALQDE